MSILTALIIRTNGENIHCEGAGPDKDGKYAGFVELWKDDRLHDILVQTRHTYSTRQEAVDTMKRLVTEVCEMDLPRPADTRLAALLAEEES